MKPNKSKRPVKNPFREAAKVPYMDKQPKRRGRVSPSVPQKRKVPVNDMETQPPKIPDKKMVHEPFAHRKTKPVKNPFRR